MELHHKVPRFLGGSDEDWNLELITSQEHLDRHIEIAEEIDTFEAWASVIACIRNKNLKYNRQYVLKRFSKAVTGKNHPRYGKKHTKETKQIISMKVSGINHGMYGKKHNEITLRKMSKIKNGNNNPMNKGKYVCGEFGTFDTAISAAKKLKIASSTVIRRCKKNYNKDWYFIPKGEKNVRK